VSRAWAGGSTRAWRRLRLAIIARDGYRCRAHADGWCERSGARAHTCRMRVQLHGPNAGEPHHTLGKAVTGDDPAHIVTACRPCNQAIGEPRQPDARPAPRTVWRKP